MSTHFSGKQPLEHVIAARQKGIQATSEVHGEELPGHYNAAADSAKETAFLVLMLWILFQQIGFERERAHWILIVFLIGWLVWKVGRSAILGWRRLERLHRLIEEERWEIEHHRPQEKEELKAIYAAKGFSGPLLDEVVEVLMADDNRLLQEMLEEELGLRLASYEHPLKQASGAAIGVIGTSILFTFSLFTLPAWGPFFCAAFVIILSAGTSAQLEKNRLTSAIIWNLAIALLALSCVYFVGELLSSTMRGPLL